MSDFIKKDALWDIIFDTYYNDGNPDAALKKIYSLLLETHGSVGIDGDKLRFTPDRYAHLNYLSYSSSIIRMPDGTMTDDTPLSIKEREMIDEYIIIGHIVRRINYALKDIESRNRVIYFNKLLRIRSISDICKDFNTYNNEIYNIENICGWKVKQEFMLRSRTKEIQMKQQIDSQLLDANQLLKSLSSFSTKNKD